MFFSIPLLLTFGILYLIGEYFFVRLSYRWLFIIFAFILTWTASGFLIFYRVGLSIFMETTDVLGYPIPWFDGDWSPWFVWIVSMVGVCFLGGILIAFSITWPLARKKWWQFWKR